MPEINSILPARVVSVKPFGAFVDLEGFEKNGLVHISQLAFRRVNAVEEVLKEGDEIKVLVTSTDNQRISCSLRLVDQATGERVPNPSDRPKGNCFNCGLPGHEARECPMPRQPREGGGVGGGGGGVDASQPLPELYSCHRAEVAKVEGFGAFCKLPGFRKQGLVHISQVSNMRVEAEDLPHILEVGEDVYVKVISVDAETGKVGLSMKLVSQSDGRDLDPSHAEAQSEGERGGGRGGGGRGGGLEARREQAAASASMAVPEYGGRPKIGGGPEYEMLPEEAEERPAPGVARCAPASGTYQLRLPNGDAPPPPPPPPAGGVGACHNSADGADLDARQRMQVELAARVLAQDSARKHKKEKSHRSDKKSHKGHKGHKSHKKDKDKHRHKSSHKEKKSSRHRSDKKERKHSRH